MLRENPNVTKEQIDSIIASVRADCEYADEVRLADSGTLFHHSGAAPRDADALVMEAHAEEYRDDLAHNRIDRVRDDVVRRASATGLKIGVGSLDERLIGRAILKEFIRSCEKAAADSRSQLAYIYPETATCRDLADGQELPPQAAPPAVDVQVETRHVSVRPTLPIEEFSPPKETVEQNPRLAKLSKNALPSRNLDPNTPAKVAWRLFVADRKRFEGIEEREAKLNSSLKLWQRVHGDHPVCTWTPQQAEELRRVFVLLPAKYGQEEKWTKLGDIRLIMTVFQNEIELAPTLDEKRALMATANKDKTWNRHNSTLRQFWPWAIRNGLVPKEAPNPFEALHIKLDEDAEPWEGGSQLRLMWEEAPLRQLLNSPLFLGCKTANERHLSGSLVVRDLLYWGVIIMANTGMRREELCQLRRKHVEYDEQAQIWFFNLKAKGLRLKEKASKRWVPISNNLLRLGIVAALFDGKEQEELLFPEAYASAADGAYGTKLGKMFFDYRKAFDGYWRANTVAEDFVPIYRPLMDLHSFRTTVATNLIRLGVPQAHAEEVTGHKSEARKTAFAIYDRGATLKILKDALDTLVLPVGIEELVSAAAHAHS